MADALLLAAALVGTLGFARLALAQERHRRVLEAPALTPAARQRQRRAALGLLALSLGLCWWGEGWAFGSVLWFVGISLAAALVAFTLSYRPRSLRCLT